MRGRKTSATRIVIIKEFIKILFFPFITAVVFGLILGFVFDIRLFVRPSQKFLALSRDIKLIGRATPTIIPEPSAEFLASEVVPEKGYAVNVKWGDTGVRLVTAGGIDMEKYRKDYSDEKYQDLLTFLTEYKNGGITINRDNAYFWVNTLWALGLTQKSDVLEKGIMATKYKDKIANFASTAGWVLGAKDAVSLYSSSEIIPLTSSQQRLVGKITQGIYRPCCGNPASFPDCNHGMAILGLVELMASQGFSEEEIYKAALAFNSYWFTKTYVDLAYYFHTEEGSLWKDVDAKRVLSAEFSSGLGYRNIKQKIKDIPASPSSGGSCGV